MGFLNLDVIVLVLFLTAVCVDKLRIHLVGKEVVVRRDGDWVVRLLHLARKVVGYEGNNDGGFTNASYK